MSKARRSRWQRDASSESLLKTSVNCFPHAEAVAVSDIILIYQATNNIKSTAYGRRDPSVSNTALVSEGEKTNNTMITM